MGKGEKRSGEGWGPIPGFTLSRSGVRGRIDEVAVMEELGGGAASLVWGPEVVGMVMARVVELGCAPRSLK